MIYFLKPKISGINEEIWEEFYKGAYGVLRDFKPHKIIEIDRLEGFSFRSIPFISLLIFFVPNLKNYNLEKIVREAAEMGVKVFPISTSKNNRFPYESIKKNQSFDVVTEKELRGLDDNYIKLVGECFGREVIISHFPAFFNKKMNIFLSHRRLDAKEANFFKNSLHSEKDHVFIDLQEIRTGEAAQEKIEKNLTEEADILIFIQTKTTFQSEGQLIELKKAFELGVPILWVTLGLEKNEFKKLSLHPVGSPHFELEKLTNSNVNEIVNYAFGIIRLRKQRLLDNVIYKFDSLKKKGIKYNELSDKNNIYLIEEIKEDFFNGGQEVLTKIFECLCRGYREDDLVSLKEQRDKIAGCFNSIIYSTRGKEKKIEEGLELKLYSNLFKQGVKKNLKGGIIISGSFPEKLDLQYQQNIVDAISIISEDILSRDGKIIFGSHPTFQGIILEKAKKVNTDTEKKVNLYVSKKFNKFYKNNLDYFYENSNIFEIEESEEGDISTSLTKMREEMINDNEAIALICIGGKEQKDSLTKVAGVEEEINLAKEKGLPVFVIGSTGGRSKTLIDEGFKNPLKETENEIISYENNFKLISKIILDSLT